MEKRILAVLIAAWVGAAFAQGNADRNVNAGRPAMRYRALPSRRCRSHRQRLRPWWLRRRRV